MAKRPNQQAVGSGYEYKSDETIVNTTDHVHTEWVEFATADNSTASATKTAETGKVHHIKNISGGFDSGASGIQLSLFDGSTEIARWYVHDQFEIDLSGLPMSEGNKAEAVISPSGNAGVVGSVCISGTTTTHGGT